MKLFGNSVGERRHTRTASTSITSPLPKKIRLETEASLAAIASFTDSEVAVLVSQAGEPIAWHIRTSLSGSQAAARVRAIVGGINWALVPQLQSSAVHLASALGVPKGPLQAATVAQGADRASIYRVGSVPTGWLMLRTRDAAGNQGAGNMFTVLAADVEVLHKALVHISPTDN